MLTWGALLCVLVFWRCVPSGLLPAIDNRTRESMKYPKSVKPPPSYPSIVLGARTIVTKMLEDLIRTWKVILVCIILAAFISFLWILLMRLCTRAMVYFTLLIFVGIFGAATGFCFWRYVETKKLSADPPPFYFTIDITVYFRYATTWLALGIISAIILLLVLAIIIFLRKRIALAHFVIGETSKAIADLPITLLWPIFPFILIVGVIVLWFFVDMNLRSIAVSEGVLFSNSAPEPKAKFSNEWVRWALSGASKCDPTANTTSGGICHFVRQIGQAYIPWLQVYNFAMCLWLVNYVIALDQATLAGAFASFYFSDHHRRHGSSGQRRRQWGCCGAALLLSTFSTALFYHTGSLALGSLLITLFSLIRMILLRLQRKLKLAENPVAKFFLRCMCCCFWCLEKFLRFLNKNAYIIMAIYGHGFCRSARDAFGLILRNVVRVFVVEKTTDFILFVGKITVCAFSSCVAYAYMSGRVSNFLLINSEQGLHLNYMIIPILVIALASYLVAKAFFTVYEIGADTIFVCVCEDLERNDGTPEKPYFMGQSMMRTLKKPDPDTTN
uniref:Choline transporter-like protein n=1 Tax=Mesocestoides corti TaxID=53468 RepID=A0A5K3FMV1_MESCO